jgi:hypothetical protein
VVVHLDFGDVGALAGDVVNDRIGEAYIIRTHGGDDDLHEEGAWDWGLGKGAAVC